MKKKTKRAFRERFGFIHVLRQGPGPRGGVRGERPTEHQGEPGKSNRWGLSWAKCSDGRSVAPKRSDFKSGGGRNQHVVVFGVVGSNAPKTVRMLMATSADKDRAGEPGWAKDMAEVLVGMFEQEVAAAAAVRG